MIEDILFYIPVQFCIKTVTSDVSHLNLVKISTFYNAS